MIFNLGDDLDVFSLLAEDLANVLDVGAVSHEGSENHVQLKIDTV